MVLLQAVMFTACQTAAVIAAILVFAPLCDLDCRLVMGICPLNKGIVKAQT